VDVVIVGAGAAGVGTGVVLRDLGVSDFVLLERHDVGASFDQWPAEMRFITPSFPGNAFGMMDLNAVALGTSPGYSLHLEHPSGPDYARYLRMVAQHWQLPVDTNVDVTAIVPHTDQQGFLVRTSRGSMRTKFIIWAAGEFQYPRQTPFPGAEYALHNAHVRSWTSVEGDQIDVIGGYESGVDAAYQLCKLGKRVRLFDAAPTWDTKSGDPSLALSPYTRERLNETLATGRLDLHFGTPIQRIEALDNQYVIVSENGEHFHTAHRPILATGFSGSLRLIADLFDWSQHGNALLTENDESTKTPGLFVVGPMVRHPGAIFCFIYKFRQRFAVVGRTIAERLDLDLEPLSAYRSGNMLLDDLSCCDDSCVC
jgi:thioredoxin reductase